MSNSSQSGFITLAKAIEMTARLRQNRDKIIDPSYSGRDIVPFSDRFDRKVFDALLAKPNCTYIRIYHGMDEDLKLKLIVVAVDDKDRDILPDADKLEASAEDIGDDTLRCPPVCPPPSPLNEP